MLNAENILCIGSSSAAASKQALHLAQHLGATLHGVPPPRQGREAGWNADEFEKWATQFVSEEAMGNSLHIPEELPNSTPALLRYVADANIDLVVADIPPDRGAVPPLAANSTRTLIQQLDCPIFVVEHRESPPSIHDLLVPTDLSDSALHAFKHAVHLARVYDAEVHALHVVDSLPYVALTPTDRLSLGTAPLSEHRGRRGLQAFLREGKSSDVPIHSHLAYGDAADQIVHFTNREEPDLMVLPSHGGGNQSRAPLGQVAQSVLGRVTCPVFLLPTFGTSLLSHSRGSETGTAAP